MFETGAEGEVTLPVSAWLLRHPKGAALFDTGLPAVLTADCERRQKLGRVMQVTFDEDATVAAQLRASDEDPGRIDFVVVSHLHFDHVGGLSMIPNATVVIQRTEWEAAMAIEDESKSFNKRADHDLGHTLKLIDGEHDLFGDGAVTCIPTPGHTVGHQSLRVRSAAGEVVLASDCCYFARTLDGGPLPTFGADFDLQRRSIDRLRKLRDGGATIIPGHDIEVVRAMPRLLGGETERPGRDPLG